MIIISLTIIIKNYIRVQDIRDINELTANNR